MNTNEILKKLKKDYKYYNDIMLDCTDTDLYLSLESFLYELDELIKLFRDVKEAEDDSDDDDYSDVF
jgi:hypothetical protein